MQECWINRLWDDTKNQDNGNKLRLYRLFKNRIESDCYVTQSMPRYLRKMIANLRCGSLQIKVETGRYENVPLPERSCTFCSDGSIEDEIHVLLHCELYNDIRYRLLQHMNSLIENFNELPPVTQYCTIMTTSSCQYILAKYLFKMMKRRNIHDIS